MDDEQLEAWLTRAVEEAVKLRKMLPAVDVGDGPNAIHTQLVKARGVLDRVEEIAVQLIRLKGRTKAAVVAAKHALREAEDQAYTARRVSFDQFVTAREREAYTAQQTLDEKAQLMTLEQTDIRVGTVLEAVTTIRWGIDGYRRDADSRLRLFAVERQLER